MGRDARAVRNRAWVRCCNTAGRDLIVAVRRDGSARFRCARPLTPVWMRTRRTALRRCARRPFPVLSTRVTACARRLRACSAQGAQLRVPHAEPGSAGRRAARRVLQPEAPEVGSSRAPEVPPRVPTWKRPEWSPQTLRRTRRQWRFAAASEEVRFELRYPRRGSGALLPAARERSARNSTGKDAAWIARHVLPRISPMQEPRQVPALSIAVVVARASRADIFATRSRGLLDDGYAPKIAPTSACRNAPSSR